MVPALVGQPFVVGRLQLPVDYVDALELERRVRLTLDDDHINVWPDQAPGNGGGGRGEDES